jgi:transcription initiation factor TFIIB
MSNVCVHPVIITDDNAGETLCQKCGTVLTQKTTDTRMNVVYTPDEFNQIRHSGPPIVARIYDCGLSTIINAQDLDSALNKIPIKNKQMFYRLRRLDKRSRTKKDTSLTKALLFLDGLKNDLVIPDYIVEQSAQLYRKCVYMKLNRGKPIKTLMVACIYIVCRLNGIPRSLLDMKQYGNVEKKQLSRVIRDIISRLDINLNEYDVTLFISRIVNNMGLGEMIKRVAIDLFYKSKEKMITSGKQPLAQAAAYIYIACLLEKKKITQGTIAHASGVSEVTLRNRVKTIKKVLGVVMD